MAKPQRVDGRRVTVHQDDVARVDMRLDEEGDVEVVTLFRDGNRWSTIEASPTVLSPRAFLAGLVKLEVLGIGPDDVEAVAGALMAAGQQKLAETLVGAAKIVDTDGWRRG